jgi:predicted Zn-dependent protease
MPQLRSAWRLSHARGYLALGLLEEAAEELEFLSPEEASTLEALALRAELLQCQEQWLLLQPLAASLVKQQPGEAGWWIMWAYATRRAESLAAAESILRDAEVQHAKEPMIQFNLGCYACQRGDLGEARLRVDRAVELDPAFRALIKTDPDLEPLRKAGYAP